MNSAFFDSIRLLANKKQFQLPVAMAQVVGKDRRFRVAAEAITRSKNTKEIIEAVNRLDQARIQKEKDRKLLGNPRQRRAPDGFLSAMKVAVKHRGRKVALSYAHAVKRESQFSSPLEKQASKLTHMLSKRHTNVESIKGIARLARRKSIKRKKKWATALDPMPDPTFQPQQIPTAPDGNAPYIIWMTPKIPKAQL